MEVTQPLPDPRPDRIDPVDEALLETFPERPARELGRSG
jgi:hypothetical protein